MENYLEKPKSDLLKWSILLLSGIFLFFIAIYPDEYKAFPAWAQVITAIILVSANIIAGIFWDEIKARVENRSLRQEISKISERTNAVLSAKDAELADLREVIVQFLEYSEVYKEKIIKYLALNEDYLCIAKSSEGLSEVFLALDKKQQLPFSKVLAEWPGSIKPFENMNLYFLPVSKLQGFDARKVRGWVNKNIIPKVEKERESFLANLTAKKRKLAQEFSYKYVAIVVRKNSIEYDTLRRKFNKSFMDNIIVHQSKKRIAKMADQLTEVITAKDFFLLVDWSSFANLNRDQRDLLQHKKQELYDQLVKNKINTLSDIEKLTEDKLISIFKKVYKTEFSNIKYKNLAHKVISGTSSVLTILRKSGVHI